MKKALWIFVWMAAAIPTLSAQVPERYPSSVQVSGHAEKEVTPDEFWLSITLDERDSKGKISVAGQERDLVAALRAIGVDPEKQLRRSDAASEFVRRKGALASATYQLKLTSSAQLAAAMEAVSEKDPSRVELVRVSHSQLEALTREVRQAAVVDAKTRATELAEAIGQKLGPCFSIVDWTSEVMPEYQPKRSVNSMRARSEEADMAVETGAAELDFRTIKLRYNVQAKFVLKDPWGQTVD